MSEVRALTVHQQNQITPSVWQMVREIAPAMHQSRLFGVNSPEQAAAIMLQGHELGLPLVASFRFVQVIQGKPSLSPQGCLALIHQHSDLVEVKIEESTDQRCTVWMRRKDTGFEFRKTWMMADAQRAGVVKPDSGWDKYPSNMLMWRVLGFVADVVCPDLIGGLKRADELGTDIDREGNVVEGNWAPADTAPAASPVAKVLTAPSITLDDLLAQYTPEQIMTANEGRIPGTDGEVAAVAEKLAATNG